MIINVTRCEICKKVPHLIIDKDDFGYLECSCYKQKLNVNDFLIFPVS